MTQQDRIAEIQVRLTFGKHSRPPGQVEDMQFLLDLLADWVPDDATRRRVLVDNPAELYGF